MQIKLESSFDFNCQMFQEVSLQDRLHDVAQPQIDKLIFETIEFGPFDQPIQKDENDEQKSEICQETLQNTGFRKIPEIIVQSLVQTRSSQNNHRQLNKPPTKAASKSKKITKQKVGSKKDYKKNICGYITRRVLKQSLGAQYQEIIDDLCKKFKAPTYKFYKIYRAHHSQNITGPTHFYNLVNPKIITHDLNESIKDISIRMVFLAFFQWFVRNRYIRYLMGDGKMTHKDKYVNYKDREMMFLIVSQLKQMLERVRNNLKEGFSAVETAINDFSVFYSEMTQNNRFEMSNQKEQKPKYKTSSRSIGMTQFEINVQIQSEPIRKNEQRLGLKFEILGMQSERINTSQ